MARPREFDEADVIAKATLVFWEHGYESTSISALEAATGLSRISIYNTFRDKEGLFLAVLDHYHATVRGQLLALLADDGLDGIERFFRVMVRPQPAGSPMQHGCLMVNAVLDSIDAALATERIQNYRQMFKTAFVGALNQAQLLGQLDSSHSDTERRADYLVGLLWGLLVTTRLAQDTTAAEPLVDVLCDVLGSWRA